VVLAATQGVRPIGRSCIISVGGWVAPSCHVALASLSKLSKVGGGSCRPTCALKVVAIQRGIWFDGSSARAGSVVGVVTAVDWVSGQHRSDGVIHVALQALLGTSVCPIEVTPLVLNAR